MADQTLVFGVDVSQLNVGTDQVSVSLEKIKKGYDGVADAVASSGRSQVYLSKMVDELTRVGTQTNRVQAVLKEFGEASSSDLGKITRMFTSMTENISANVGTLKEKNIREIFENYVRGLGPYIDKVAEITKAERERVAAQVAADKAAEASKKSAVDEIIRHYDRLKEKMESSTSAAKRSVFIDDLQGQKSALEALSEPTAAQSQRLEELRKTLAAAASANSVFTQACDSLDSALQAESVDIDLSKTKLLELNKAIIVVSQAYKILAEEDKKQQAIAKAAESKTATPTVGGTTAAETDTHASAQKKQLEDLQQALVKTEEKYRSLGEQVTVFSASISKDTPYASQVKNVKAAEEALTRYKSTLLITKAATEELVSRAPTMDQSTFETSAASLRGLQEELKKTAEAQKHVISSTIEQERQDQVLRDSLDQASAAERRHREALSALSDALARGSINQQEYETGAARLARSLKDQLSDIGKNDEATRKFSLSANALAMSQASVINTVQALASGMSPLRVALMEIPQFFGYIMQDSAKLKTAIQGVISAFSALTFPIVAAVAAVVSFGVALVSRNNELKDTKMFLDAYGVSTLYTTQAVLELAEANSKLGGSLSENLNVLKAMAADKALAGIAAQLSSLSPDMAAKYGLAIEDMGKKLHAAFSGGYDSLVRFNDEMGGALNPTIMGTIRSLMEQGKTVEALNMALGGYQKHSQGAAEASRTVLSSIGHSVWNAAAAAINHTADAVNGFLGYLAPGRDTTENLQRRIDELSEKMVRLGGASTTSGKLVLQEIQTYMNKLDERRDKEEQVTAERDKQDKAARDALEARIRGNQGFTEQQVRAWNDELKTNQQRLDSQKGLGAEALRNQAHFEALQEVQKKNLTVQALATIEAQKYREKVEGVNIALRNKVEADTRSLTSTAQLNLVTESGTIGQINMVKALQVYYQALRDGATQDTASKLSTLELQKSQEDLRHARVEQVKSIQLQIESQEKLNKASFGSANQRIEAKADVSYAETFDKTKDAMQAEIARQKTLTLGHMELQTAINHSVLSMNEEYEATRRNNAEKLTGTLSSRVLTAQLNAENQERINGGGESNLVYLKGMDAARKVREEFLQQSRELVKALREEIEANVRIAEATVKGSEEVLKATSFNKALTEARKIGLQNDAEYVKSLTEMIYRSQLLTKATDDYTKAQEDASKAAADYTKELENQKSVNSKADEAYSASMISALDTLAQARANYRDAQTKAENTFLESRQKAWDSFYASASKADETYESAKYEATLTRDTALEKANESFNSRMLDAAKKLNDEMSKLNEQALKDQEEYLLKKKDLSEKYSVAKLEGTEFLTSVREKFSSTPETDSQAQAVQKLNSAQLALSQGNLTLAQSESQKAQSYINSIKTMGSAISLAAQAAALIDKINSATYKKDQEALDKAAADKAKTLKENIEKAKSTYDDTVADLNKTLSEQTASANDAFDKAMRTASRTFENSIESAKKTLNDSIVSSINTYNNSMESATRTMNAAIMSYFNAARAAVRTYGNTVAEEQAKVDKAKADSLAAEKDLAAKKEDLNKAVAKARSEDNLVQQKEIQNLIDKNQKLDQGLVSLAGSQSSFLSLTLSKEEGLPKVNSVVDTLSGTYKTFGTAAADSLDLVVQRTRAAIDIMGQMKIIMSQVGATPQIGNAPAGTQFSASELINSLGGLSTGGIVEGPGTSTSDSVPKRLSRGEFVVKADAVSKYRSTLELINQGLYTDTSDSPAVNVETTRTSGPVSIVINIDGSKDAKAVAREVVAEINRTVYTGGQPVIDSAAVGQLRTRRAG